jgi:hypothetical protein
MKFTDSIEGNLDILKELLAGQTQAAHHRAALAAGKIEKVVMAIQRDAGNDAAAGLGMTFAIFLLAARMVEQDGGSKGLIELLS